MATIEFPANDPTDRSVPNLESQQQINQLVDSAWALSVGIGGELGDVTAEDGRLVQKASSPEYSLNGTFLSGRLEATIVVEQNRFEHETAGPLTVTKYFDAYMNRNDTPLHFRYLPVRPHTVVLIDDADRSNDRELRPASDPEFEYASRAITELERAIHARA